MGANRHGRLLLVEDEVVLRGLVAQFLGLEGFEVVEAADGGEGIERFGSRGPFDLVLLDLELPVCSGVEVCRSIRMRSPQQPVLICSAAVLDSHLSALSALGVDQILTKPYHPTDLLKAIGSAGNRVPPHPAEAGNGASDVTDRVQGRLDAPAFARPSRSIPWSIAPPSSKMMGPRLASCGSTWSLPNGRDRSNGGDGTRDFAHCSCCEGSVSWPGNR